MAHHVHNELTSGKDLNLYLYLVFQDKFMVSDFSSVRFTCDQNNTKISSVTNPYGAADNGLTTEAQFVT